MSGLYNVVMGDGNEMDRGVLLGTLISMQPDQFQRFRDAWVERDDAGELRIAVYTRLGGGNRPDYQSVYDVAKRNPLFLFDQDDSYDSTYATFYFKVRDDLPSDVMEVLTEVAHPHPIDKSAQWEQALNRLQTEGPTEREMEAFKPIGEALQAALSGQPMPDQSGAPVQVVIPKES